MTPTIHDALICLLDPSWPVSCLDAGQKAALTRAGLSTGGGKPTLTAEGLRALQALRESPAEIPPECWHDVGGRRWATDGCCAIREDCPRPLQSTEPWSARDPGIAGLVDDRGLTLSEEGDDIVVTGPALRWLFDPRFGPVLRAGRLRAAGDRCVEVLDAEGRIMAIVARMTR